MTDAICRDDVEAVRELVVRHPPLLHEDARGVKGNWGPPMSYAANLGRDRIIAMLHSLGATDTEFAFDRACLFASVVTQPIRLRYDDEFARLLLDRGADPNVRATLRKQLRGVDDESMHEYRDVTPLGWGQRCHDQDFDSKPAMRLIAERGGENAD
jgi:hypothetical protein